MGGLNSTPSSDRIHIGIFGKRNAGKSSIINAMTGQSLAIVSEVKGTTTDPVSKAMELLPLGPVMMIDTPGIDDTGELGTLRVKKSYQVLNKTDIAVLVIDAPSGPTSEDYALLKQIDKKQIPCVVVLNKADVMKSQNALDNEIMEIQKQTGLISIIAVSAKSKMGIHDLKEIIASQVKDVNPQYPIVSDLIEPSDLVVLVIPIDKAAPKGRLILPQQQTIRDILDCGGVVVVVKEDELKNTLQSLGKKPKLVITDSQVFHKVSADTPADVLLTSFSILFARHKGELKPLLEGIDTVDRLGDGDKVLICEGCTHHRQCGDIGTEKIPAWIKKHTQARPEFTFTSGTEFPENLQEYQFVIHCGGCMLNEREMKYRIASAQDAGTPITNYGMLIAHMNGILKRSMELFV